jgi:ABC-type bacteriocin/lantibiotic exporter with double-glycine peptidase domain
MKMLKAVLGVRRWPLLALGLLMVSGVASAAYVYLVVPIIGQTYSQWCHAGSIQMIIRAYGNNSWTQCDIVKKEFNSSSCPNNPATTTQLCDGIRRIGYTCTNTNAPLSWSASWNEIASYHPFVVRIGWTGGGGHFMVIRGVDNTSPTYVTYNNPLPVGSGSASNWVTYSYMRSNSSWTWTHTMNGIH